ncbi:hypothetical protein ACH5RR_035374 [Cinchona calisaya]|uniref:DC1 domain-containing protein n=1 Tax=Cinchona calisaya TaxID=153742 RepID=A0ABD2YJ03_9GENT
MSKNYPFISKPETTLHNTRSSSSSSSSMQLMMKDGSPPYLASASAPPVEFPTSPQPAAGGEDVTLIHYRHPKHPLAQKTLPELFVCGGCKEYGAGKRFTCQECDFQLHDFCALSPPSLRDHPLHAQHELVFHSRPKQAGISWAKCDICGKSSKGFTFRCRACSFQMHPCCAMLSSQITFPEVHAHPLKLLPPAPAVNYVNGQLDDPAAVVCGECKKKRSGGRVYRCTVCSSDNYYHLHAVCAKSMINGLRANGITPPDQKPNNNPMFGIAVHLASRVVIEFIGGLIEGFGEGVGQVLVQSIGGGRGRSRRLRRSSSTSTTTEAEAEAEAKSSSATRSSLF